jgi:hypothetical protein
MRPRHWDSLSAELALELHPDKAYTLDKALKQGLLGHLEVLSKTADVASKEYSIEQVRYWVLLHSGGCRSFCCAEL